MEYLGYGLGLRAQHYQDILDHSYPVDWFEIITENYLVSGGRPLHNLQQIRERYPIAMHGVSLSIGSSDPLNTDYLTQVKNLIDKIQPAWVSDHLCWTGVDGLNMHDLLPLPYTEEALAHVVARVKYVQDYFDRQILLENVSSYINYTQSQLTEWEFLAEVAAQADCKILLDVNNVYVSAFNHGFQPQTYLDAIAPTRVQQFHIAGHINKGSYIIDTHDQPVVDEVWQVYAAAVKRFGKVSTMIERDDNIPPLTELLAELEQARNIANPILAQVGS